MTPEKNVPPEAEVIFQKLWPVIREALAGKGPLTQGAVIADLTAVFVAGHKIQGDPEATAKLRADIIALHATTVLLLVDCYDKVEAEREKAVH